MCGRDDPPAAGSPDAPAAPDDLIVVGVGGFGREVIDIVDAMSVAGRSIRLIGSVDDDLDADSARLAELGVTLLGTIDHLVHRGGHYAIGIGDGAVRRSIVDRLPAHCVPTALRHPASTVGGHSVLAPGSILAAGARLTTNVSVGRHADVHVNATVGHDSVIGDYATLLPGAIVSGGVTVGPGALIGAGATVLQGLTIGAGATVGAGAVVTGDVAPDTTVVGVPAKPISIATDR